MSTSDLFVTSLILIPVQTLLPSIQTLIPSVQTPSSSTRSWATYPIIKSSIPEPTSAFHISLVSPTPFIATPSSGAPEESRVPEVVQTNPSSLNTTAIAGAVVGAVVFILLLAGCMFYLGQLYRRKESQKSMTTAEHGFKSELDGYALEFDSRDRRDKATAIGGDPQELHGDFEARELPDDEKLKHTVAIYELSGEDTRKERPGAGYSKTAHTQHQH